MSQINRDFHADTSKLPEHLREYDLLLQHFRANLEGLSKTEKGDRFAHFASRVIPQTSTGSDYEYPALNPKKSRDEGIDLIAQSLDGTHALYVQAKLYVDRASEIDSVISKFQAYHQKISGSKGQLALFSDEPNPPHFMLITLSPLSGILKSYEQGNLSTKQTYDSWAKDNRIHFIDGYQILRELQTAYRKLGEVPLNISLGLVSEFLQQGNVFLGIVSSDELRKLYSQYGDSLFFENIRDFLGLAEERTGRTTPNAEIVKTIRNNPEKMLERNNGIVIRADRVEFDSSRTFLKLTRGSVVNGCQTTMCLIKFAEDTCYVQAKIVETNQSWEITKAANYQTTVPDIDLELARVLRPQLARRAAVVSGVGIEAGQASAFQLIDEIYSQRVAYDETRLIFIALFSNTPNNVYGPNYTELVTELVNRFYDEDPHGQAIFDAVFLIQEALQEATETAEKTLTHSAYSEKFQRFFKPDKPAYRCFVCLLALCASLGIDISERQREPDEEYTRMQDFFNKTKTFLQERRTRFIRYYILAARTWMQTVMPPDVNEAEGQRDMSIRSKRAPFSGMLRNLYMDADLDDLLRRDAENHTG